jgi:hypothetical protein
MSGTADHRMAKAAFSGDRPVHAGMPAGRRAGGR